MQNRVQGRGKTLSYLCPFFSFSGFVWCGYFIYFAIIAMDKIDSIFDLRSTQKKIIHSEHQSMFFKERDVFFIRMWQNIRFEQNGKGTRFIRPVVIIKKFNNDIFRWIALSSREKAGKYYYSFLIDNLKQYAILSQFRLYDKNRLVKKIWMIDTQSFFQLKEKIKALL